MQLSGRGAPLVVHDLDPAVEQHCDRGVLVRSPAGFDVGDQALGVELGVAAVAAGFAAKVGPLAGHGVQTCVDGRATEQRDARNDASERALSDHWSTPVGL